MGNILFINIDGLNAFPCISEDEYDKYNLCSAVVKALYMLKYLKI